MKILGITTKELELLKYQLGECYNGRFPSKEEQELYNKYKHHYTSPGENIVYVISGELFKNKCSFIEHSLQSPELFIPSNLTVVTMDGIKLLEKQKLSKLKPDIELHNLVSETYLELLENELDNINVHQGLKTYVSNMKPEFNVLMNRFMFQMILDALYKKDMVDESDYETLLHYGVTTDDESVTLEDMEMYSKVMGYMGNFLKL